MPATTNTHSSTISQRRERERVVRSSGSRVSESMRCLGTSPDVASHRQGDRTRYQSRLQARELVLDWAGRLDPAAAQRLVEAEQRLEPCQPHLCEQILGTEQRGL